MLPDDPSQWIQNSDDGRSGLLQHQVNAIRGRHRIQRKTGACPCLDRGDQPGGLQRSDVRGSDPGRVVEKGQPVYPSGMVQSGRTEVHLPGSTTIRTDQDQALAPIGLVPTYEGRTIGTEHR